MPCRRTQPSSTAAGTTPASTPTADESLLVPRIFGVDTSLVPALKGQHRSLVLLRCGVAGGPRVRPLLFARIIPHALRGARSPADGVGVFVPATRERCRHAATQLDRIIHFWNRRIQATGPDRERLWWADRPSAVQWIPGTLPPCTIGETASISRTSTRCGRTEPSRIMGCSSVRCLEKTTRG